jgi:hypothetical protein
MIIVRHSFITLIMLVYLLLTLYPNGCILILYLESLGGNETDGRRNALSPLLRTRKVDAESIANLLDNAQHSTTRKTLHRTTTASLVPVALSLTDTTMKKSLQGYTICYETSKKLLAPINANKLIQADAVHYGKETLQARKTVTIGQMIQLAEYIAKS